MGENKNFSSFAEKIMADAGVEVTLVQVMTLGIIQVLRHQGVPPTSLGKYDGVMMPVLGGGGWSSKL